MQTFGLLSWIVIGYTIHLILFANHNATEKTKSLHPQQRAISYAKNVNSVLSGILKRTLFDTHLHDPIKTSKSNNIRYKTGSDVSQICCQENRLSFINKDKFHYPAKCIQRFLNNLSIYE